MADVSIAMIACKSNAGISFQCPAAPHGHSRRKPGSRGGWWRKFKARMLNRIPVGYQDETGFHYGVQPKPSPPSVPEKKPNPEKI
jgi:hypothetical protein